METILTLNVRGHVMLPMFRDHFKMTSRRMKSEIQAMHRETVTTLRGKGIAYGDLMSAGLRCDFEDAAVDTVTLASEMPVGIVGTDLPLTASID